MHLPYLLTGFSFILIQYVTSALPVTNENGILQRPSLIKRDNKVHLVKRKKHHREDSYYPSRSRGRYQEYPDYDDDDYSYEDSDYDRHDDYFNPRYSSGHSNRGYSSSYGSPYMNPYYGSPYPMVYTAPIGTVSGASYSTLSPNMVNSVTPSSIVLNSAPGTATAVTPDPNPNFTAASSVVSPPAP